jgi:hypothetical protein
MADLQITDEFGLNTSLQLRDDSPLAKAKLTHLASITQSLKDEIDKPIDQTSLKDVTFGVDCSIPQALIGSSASITVGAGVSGAILILRPVDKTLFPDDTFAPVPISPDQCWIGVELDVSVDADLQGTADGFGVGIEGTAKLRLTTFALIQATGDQFPVFRDALKSALDHFYVASTADSLRNQAKGTICVTEVCGTVTLSGSYQLPISVNALASADLPFNFTISVDPEATLKLSGSIALSGDLMVRLHKVTDTTLNIGVYKKRGSTLAACFTAGLGIGVDHGSTDLATGFLTTVLPGVDCTKSGITGDTATSLNSALNDCIDRSLSIAMNVSCSAATTDEAAVIYSVDLSAGSADATDAALKAALQGDWTRLSQLGNARLIRDIVTNSKEYKNTIAINLFGLYNAATIDTYVQSCTILHDENGQVAVIDKTDTSRISVTAAPYAADSDKLRTALAQDFLSTASYAVVASRVQPEFVIQQSYFLYDKRLTRQEMQDQLLLGRALNLIENGSWNDTMASNPVFPHARISVCAKYNTAETLSLFFANTDQRQLRNRAEIERIGRDAMIALIDPSDPAGSQRLAALRDDQIWNAMDSIGNMALFGSIPGLKQLASPVVGAVGADWAGIVWWSDAITQTAPKVADLLTFLDTITVGDFSSNPEFLAKSKALQTALGSVTRKTHAVFVGGWGMAVVFTLTGNRSDRTMDISWGSVTKHYESNG